MPNNNQKQKQKPQKSQKVEKLEKPSHRKRKQIRWLLWTGIIMLIGLFFLKVIPMEMYGDDIMFDASAHITITVFILYVVWFFIDQNKSWRIFYLAFSLVVLTMVSLHRLIIQAHNGTGLIMGFLLSVIAILIPRWNKLKNKFDF